MQAWVLALPRAAKRTIVVALDMGLAVCATWLAYTLRLDEPNWPYAAQWWVYAIAPTLFIPFFWFWGLYRAIFRYTGQAVLLSTAKAVAAYSVVLTGVLLWMQWPGVPRTLGVLQPLIFFLCIATSRSVARAWLESPTRLTAPQIRRALIFGAGAAGVQTASAMLASAQFELVGFVDNDTAKVGRSINGVLVFSAEHLHRLIAQQRVTDILIALPSASRAQRKEIIQSVASLPVHIRTLPEWSDLASGRVNVQDFKELDIEDLLGRDAVPADRGLLRACLYDKVVLVTGAGGSIGSELCRQILLESPRQLLLMDQHEFGLYAIEQELRERCASDVLAVDLSPLLGNVLDARRVESICETYRPHTVYHAAAYKHVPLVEANPAQGIVNNVLGTEIVAGACARSGAHAFVLVSTDKAVRPTNVMGASKRMAELVVQAMTAEFPGTCFSMVRFGNVLGSSGSVVPLFRRQIVQGGPVTVTHPQVTRYFMTIPEAAQLVLHAGAMAESGELFLLDMGEPVRILDLARRMVELSGLRVRDADFPQGDIEIQMTGLRPGEKLYEELLIGDHPRPTSHPRIFKAQEAHWDWATLQPHLAYLRSAAENGDIAALSNILRQCVSGYRCADDRT